MKVRYLSNQFKQFALSSVFVMVAIAGATVSQSFNSDYVAKMDAKKAKEERTLIAEKNEKKSKSSVIAMK